jgi:rsbT antagonist protein RsbS
MARVPVVRLGDVLVATVLEDLHDRDALDLQQRVTQEIARTGARGVLLDLSVVEIVDSYLGRLIHDLSRAARLMGATAVVVGIQPAVAMTLVEMGLEMKGVRTALNSEKGMTLLRRDLDRRR